MLDIFCDTAEEDVIKKYIKYPNVKGITTNPSLMRQAGAKNYENYCKKLLMNFKNNNKTISFEVLADDHENMKKQALKINSWGNNIYVKIPIMNSKGHFQGKLIKELCDKKMKLNITAIFSFSQVQKLLKYINKDSYIYISIFAGRLGDSGKNPISVFKKTIKKVKNFKNVKVLWASTREVFHYVQAKDLGCDIITMPASMIEKLNTLGTSNYKMSLNTVKGFLIDSRKANFKI